MWVVVIRVMVGPLSIGGPGVSDAHDRVRTSTTGFTAPEAALLQEFKRPDLDDWVSSAESSAGDVP